MLSHLPALPLFTRKWLHSTQTNWILKATTLQPCGGICSLPSFLLVIHEATTITVWTYMAVDVDGRELKYNIVAMSLNPFGKLFGYTTRVIFIGRFKRS